MDSPVTTLIILLTCTMSSQKHDQHYLSPHCNIYHDFQDQKAVLVNYNAWRRNFRFTTLLTAPSDQHTMERNAAIAEKVSALTENAWYVN